MFHRLLLILTTLALSPICHADDNAVAYAYLKNGDCAQAYSAYRTLAEVGYPYYLNRMGEMHRKGLCVPADDLLAHVWYSLSAAQGDTEGQARKTELGEQLDSQERKKSRTLARDYARRYLEPYIARWSLD